MPNYLWVALILSLAIFKSSLATTDLLDMDGPWIDVIERDQATGPMAEIYQKYSSKRSGGILANIIQVHSHYPKAFEAHADFYKLLFTASKQLSSKDRQLIAVTVSEANKCLYCRTHHSYSLFNRGTVMATDKEVVELLEYPSKKHQALIQYAHKLTKTPSEMVKQDVESLKNVGFDDRTIIEINLLVGYMNFCNRIIFGLGVPVESYWKRQ